MPSESFGFPNGKKIEIFISIESVTILTSDIKIGKKLKSESKNWKCHYYNKFNGMEDDVIIFYNTIMLDR